MNRIYIHKDEKNIAVTGALRALIKRAINGALRCEQFGKNAEVSVTLCDDKKIHELNLQYRNKDAATDVLSFPMFDETDDDFAVLGDIVISLERAAAQAEEYGHSFEREVAFLCVHSVLHLLGYDHEISEEDEKEMFAHQDAIMDYLEINR